MKIKIPDSVLTLSFIKKKCLKSNLKSSDCLSPEFKLGAGS